MKYAFLVVLILGLSVSSFAKPKKPAEPVQKAYGMALPTDMNYTWEGKSARVIISSDSVAYLYDDQKGTQKRYYGAIAEHDSDKKFIAMRVSRAIDKEKDKTSLYQNYYIVFYYQDLRPHAVDFRFPFGSNPVDNNNMHSRHNDRYEDWELYTNGNPVPDADDGDLHLDDLGDLF
jgi:hypothetical protein